MIKHFNVNVNTGSMEHVCAVNMRSYYLTDVNIFWWRFQQIPQLAIKNLSWYWSRDEVVFSMLPAFSMGLYRVKMWTNTDTRTTHTTQEFKRMLGVWKLVTSFHLSRLKLLNNPTPFSFRCPVVLIVWDFPSIYQCSVLKNKDKCD